jgi:hypothetical protein
MTPGGRSLEILVTSLQDEEWLTFIWHWRCNVAVFERVIETKMGKISSETRTVSSLADGGHSEEFGARDEPERTEEAG